MNISQFLLDRRSKILWMTSNQHSQIFIKLFIFDCIGEILIGLFESKSTFGPIWVRKLNVFLGILLILGSNRSRVLISQSQKVEQQI